MTNLPPDPAFFGTRWREIRRRRAEDAYYAEHPPASLLQPVPLERLGETEDYEEQKARMAAEVDPEASAAFVAMSNGSAPQLPVIDEMLRATIELAAYRAVSGAKFVLGGGAEIRPVWGRGEEVLWAQGEPFLLAGPSGVGKTTVIGQVVRARLEGGAVLGYPVAGDDRRVLYLAMDRPPQIARSLRRIFGEDDTELLDRGLIVWRGSLPFNVVRQPEGLATLADELHAGTVVVDSVKDLSSNISNEEVGSGINAAFQIATLAGIEVAAPHHQRKPQAENKKPTTLADVYGSQMLVNGAGSVVLLWGEAGDPVVELSHLKQPAEQVGPLTVVHDHHSGTSTADAKPDAFEVVRGSHKGITAMAMAVILFAKNQPTRSDVEKARRRLDRLVDDGRIRREPGRSGGPDGGQTTLYFPLDTFHSETSG